eukprot:14609_1
MALSWYIWSLLILFTGHISTIGSNNNDHATDSGHFVAIISPHLSFILCSTANEDLLQLININDVLDNELCITSSQFSLSSHQLLLEEDTHQLTLLKINKDKPHTRNSKLIQLQLIDGSHYRYHFKFQNSYLNIAWIGDQPSSSTQPPLMLSTDHKLTFTFIPIAQSPFVDSLNQFKTHTHTATLGALDEMNTFPLIGKRVQLNGKFGVITNHINTSYSIQFDDGDIGHHKNLNFDDIHVQYAIGSAVDAYWPPDRLKLTNLADVLWPAMVVNYSNTSDSYSLRYDDGTTHPNIPSIYIVYPQKLCSDDRNDCPILAKNQQCRLNPSYAMIHCRKSCKVCTANDGNAEEEDRDKDNGLIHFNVAMNHEDGGITYRQDANMNSFDEARALNEIGEKLMLYGNVSVAEQYFLRASWLGNNDAKFNLGHVYAVKDEGREDMAVLYLYFSALGGSLSSNLALGYRHLYGYGVPKSCPVSAKYYQKAGNTLFGSSESPFNPMQQQHIEMIRLHDVNRRDTPITETDEVIRFYHSHADNGDANAQMALGQLYYYGLRGFEQDFGAAIHYFTLAAQQNHGDAYSMLGNIYVDGIVELNIEKNITKAIEYYKKAMSAKSVSGYTGMAFLYLEGIPHKNTTAAFDHFKYAAKRQDLSALFYLGLMYFNGIGVKQKSFNEAFECFMMASRRGHAQSLYYAGYMHLNGLATAKSCKMAVELFKMAAERTVIAKQLSIARSYYLDSDYDTAYYLYSKLAIQGFEVAQSNAGWLLRRNLVSQDLFYSSLDTNKTVGELSRKSAFKYFEWSAQTNADSQRIVGDYYFYNYSLDSNMNRYDEAGMYYEMSAENILGNNAQSMFNLGYMHQYGIGKKKDFSMAKRYYDLSASTDPNGQVACYILLALLYIERFMEEPHYIHYYRAIYDTYAHYTKDLNAENTALFILIIILIIVLWIRR